MTNPVSPEPEAKPSAPSTAYSSGQPAPSGPRKGLALTALIVGIVAFLTGLVPVLGIILGLVAVVIGIFALVKKQHKVFAVVGLSLGAVAMIASIIATVLAGIFTQAVIEEVERQNSAISEPAELPEATTEEPAEGEELIEVLPLGSTIHAEEWSVAATSLTPDASAEVAAANQFNEPAPAGYRYVIFELEATYEGDRTGSPMLVRVDYVTPDGEIISSLDHGVVGIEPAFGHASLAPGETHTGKVLFAVPDTLDGALSIVPGMDAEPVFFLLD